MFTTFHAFVILITRTHAQENFVITFVIFRKHITVFRSHIGKLNFGSKLSYIKGSIIFGGGWKKRFVVLC